ncbi:hypothetical protein ACI65C_006738 [Semiaphis heraclei]
MPRKFHELSDRSKQWRADEAGCSHFSYSASSSDVEITAVSPSADINIQILPFVSNDQININSDPSYNDDFPNDDQDHFENINNDFISSSYSSCSSSDKSSDDSIHEPYFQTGLESESPTGIKNFLKNWAIKHNVTEVCLSDLLVGLKSNVDGLSKLPSGARILLKTNIVFEKSIVEPDSITLDTISAFPFENYLQTIKTMIKGKNKPLEQIGKRLGQIFSIHLAFPSTADISNFQNLKMLIPMGLCLFTAVVYNILQCYFPILLLKSYHQIIAVVQKKNVILIHLIDDGEKVPDVIPNTWKIDQSSCWYQKNLKSNVINSLARKQIMQNHSSDDWEYCTMQIIETNITENKKITSNIFYIKQELNSLIESKKSSHCDEHVPTSSSANENILSPFPLKNEDELMLIESKLVSEDLSFTSKLENIETESDEKTRFTTLLYKDEL